MSELLKGAATVLHVYQNVVEDRSPLDGLQVDLSDGRQDRNSGWQDLDNGWSVMGLVGAAEQGCIRRKPVERTVHVTLPSPVLHPQQGQEVWVLDPVEYNTVSRERWEARERQRMLRDRGLLYGTEADARAVFQELFGGGE